jgi:O-antigen ligase
MTLTLPGPTRPRPYATPSLSVVAVVVGLLAGAVAGVTGIRALVLVAAAVGAAVVVRRPTYLPIVLIGTVYLQEIAPGGAAMSRVAAPFALAVLLLGFAAGRQMPRLRSGTLVLAVAYCAWSLLSVTWSLDERWTFGTPGTLYALSSLAIAVTFLVAVATFVDLRSHVARVCTAYWVLGTIFAAQGLIAWLQGASRSGSLVGDPNYFAMYQLMALPLAIVAVQAFSTTRARIAGWAGLLLIVASVGTSGSRGGVLTLVLTVLLLGIPPAIRAARRRREIVPGVVVLVALAVGAAGAVIPGLVRDATAVRGGVEASRTNLWAAALTASEEHPVFGVGSGAFTPLSNDYLRKTPGVDFSDYRLRDNGQPAHSAYIESLAELGPFGLLLFVSLLMSAVVSLWRTGAMAKGADDLLLLRTSRAVIVSIAAFAAGSLFLSSQSSRALWIVLGLTIALGRITRRTASGPEAVGARRAMVSTVDRLLDARQRLSAAAERRPLAPSAPPTATPEAPSGDSARLDLNAASFEELCALDGIGPATARGILRRRSARRFTSIDELLEVRGIGPRRIAALETLIQVREDEP